MHLKPLFIAGMVIIGIK